MIGLRGKSRRVETIARSPFRGSPRRRAGDGAASEFIEIQFGGLPRDQGGSGSWRVFADIAGQGTEKFFFAAAPMFLSDAMPVADAQGEFLGEPRSPRRAGASAGSRW